jgi:hypothetical protein
LGVDRLWKRTIGTRFRIGTEASFHTWQAKNKVAYTSISYKSVEGLCQEDGHFRCWSIFVTGIMGRYIVPPYLYLSFNYSWTWRLFFCPSLMYSLPRVRNSSCLPSCFLSIHATVRIGECPSNSPFLKNNGAEAHCF